MRETEFKIHLHNKLCEIANLIMYHYNPCGLDGNGNCVKGLIKDCCHHTVYDTKKDNQVQCLFHTETGCNTNNLGCKIWYCWESFDKLDKKVKRLLMAIEMINRIYMLTSYSEGLYIPERDEYDYRDVARYFDEDFME